MSKSTAATVTAGERHANNVPATGKHTPGPWMAVRRHEDEKTRALYVEILGPNGSGARGEGFHTAVADIYNADGEIEQANARLIAAAPELLDALKDVFALMDEGVLVRDTSKDHEPDYPTRAVQLVMRLQKANAAIAKAEGRAE